eukprot:72579_1
MASYQEYNIEDHIQPIGFQPEFRFSGSKNKDLDLHFGGSANNVLRSTKTAKGSPRLGVPNTKPRRRHIQSHSTPTLPHKQAIFEGLHQTNTKLTNATKRTQTQARGSINLLDDDMDDMQAHTPIDSRVSNTNTTTMISHNHHHGDSDSDTMISRSSRSSSMSRSTVSNSSLSNSSTDLNLMDTINHVSSHQPNGHGCTQSMVLDLGKRRTSGIHKIQMPLNNIITAQTEFKKRKKMNKKTKKKEFKYRTRQHSSSASGSFQKAISVSVSTPNSDKMKPYSGKQIDQYGHRLIPISNTKKDKISSISSSSVNKNRMKPIGGGYGNDNNDPIPSHLRAYYAIQKDLNKLKNGTKKKQNRIQLDAINTKLHSLFFANERTNIANLSAFQKFFLDRMSVQSVHKDLDWHICLLRPKIHSKFHNAQIDEIINMVADLLRKCVKKFNNKRGHLTSAANTSRIGVGTYGGGKDKSHIQSAFILSKPSSSVPPEFYQQQGGRGASQSVVTPLSTNAAFQLKKRTPQHVYTPSGSGGSLHNILSMSSNNYNQELIPAAYNTDQDSYGSPSPHSQCFSDSGDKPAILNHYDVMTPPASVQMKQEIKKNKKEKQKEKHRRLLSFSSRLRIKKKKKKQQNKMSRPNMSMQEVIALTGLPATKKAKGSDHHNVDEPYPMELFHISDMDFVVVYYVKFLTKFEKLMCELLALYQEYARLSDDMASDVALQLSLVASNPRETYTESMVKAQNTMQWGRQSREHPWIRVQTDKRKSRKFGQDLIYMVKYMKSNDIDALHELMKQAPDLNTPDRETGRTVLQIALDKSCKQPSFAFVARYLALKQLLFQQKLVDESIIMQALKTHNPMVAEILLHLDPTLSKHDAEDRSALDLALNANYRNLARYMIKLNVPPWHTQQLMRRWSSACSMGDVVKLRSVLQRGFNIDFFQNDTQKTALIICTQEEYIDCVEFLLKNGCNVNAADVEQKTALHYAAQSLNGELFRMILESKANWTLRDLNTKTAIDYVMSNIGFVPRPKASKSTKQADNSSLQTPTNTRFRAGSGANQDSPTNTFQDNTPQSEERADDMYNKKTKFWRPSGFTLKIDADDDDDNWNQFGYLVQVQGDDDDDDDDEPRVTYSDVDVQQVVKIFDVACQAGIPLDSRLLLLAVQRDWPHVILVLCHPQNNITINVDVAGKDGITPLMLASREGKKACLSAILQSGKPDLDRADTADRTPIMHAAYRGEAECVSRLVKAGASIDVETVDGTTLLMAACYGGLQDFAKYLVEENADVAAVNENGFSALLFAASEGYQDTVTLLLNNSASIDVVSRAGLTPLMSACSGGLHELVLYVLARINRSDMDETDENGWTALMHAVAAGSEKCAAILLKAGAAVSTVGDDGYSLLSIAITGNLVWMVRHILDVIRKQTTSKNRKIIYNMFNVREHGNGFTAIHEAAGIGADKCLSLLLEYNDKYFDHKMILFDAPDLNGRTPLMIASLNGHKECVNLLINQKQCAIDVNKLDKEANSVLIYAMESNQIAILNLLLQRFECKIKSETLQSAKEAAMQRSKAKVLHLLNQCQLQT